jgi:hypothetical protein
LAKAEVKPFRDWTQADVEAHNARATKQPKAQESAKSNQLEVGSGGIQDEIEDWLKSQSHRAWWTRSRTDKATTNRIGTPDFVGVFAGKPFALEVKRPGKKPTTEQLGELAWFRKAGGIATVVYSKAEAENFLLSHERTE